MEKTNYRFKFLYATCVILVLIGHCHFQDPPINPIYDFLPIYSYHIALWVFCSGYFYKKENEQNIFKYIFKKFKKLIIPFFIWNVIYGLIITYLRHKDIVTYGMDISLKAIFLKPLYNGQQFIFNLCTWFVPTLFMTHLFNVLFRKISHIKDNYIILIIYIFLGLIGLKLGYEGYNTEWWRFLTRILYFLPFYELGFLYKEKFEKKDKLPDIPYFLIIIAIVLVIKLFIEKDPIMFVSEMALIKKNFFIHLIIGLCGIAFWLRISKKVENIAKESKIINILANNSYNIMLHQVFSFFILNFVFFILHIYTPFFKDFDSTQFQTNFWYFYAPNGNESILIIYLLIGIFIPLLIAKIQNLLLNFLKKLFSKMKTKKLGN